jgi:hypothetical protein
MLCKISGFYGGDYEDCRLLRCDAVWFLYELTFPRSVLWLLLNDTVVPSAAIVVTLMMEVMCSSETLVFTRATRRNTPGNGILHNYCKSAVA